MHFTDRADININAVVKKAFKIIIGIVIAVLILASIYANIKYPGYSPGYLVRRAVFGPQAVEDDGCLYIHYIDVGQADCTLIHCEDATLLIDAGDFESYDEIHNCLDSVGVREINWFVITHPHNDHIGCASRIIEDYDVDCVIMSQPDESIIPTNSVYFTFLDTLSQNNIKVVRAKPGDSYSKGDLSFTVFGPLNNYSELNDSSVVLMAYFGENRFLFTGDAQSEAEYDLVNSGADLSADILKVGHHGSDTSSIMPFISLVDPSVAIISCGADNPYGHPSDLTLYNLDCVDADIYRTDFDGNITVRCDGINYKISTEKNYE